MDNIRVVADVEGFEWDEANRDKSWQKHRVTASEAEQIFFNQPLIVLADEKHSASEKRYFCLGKTDDERRLFLVFTVRKKYIKVISVRDMSKKERLIYEKH